TFSISTPSADISTLSLHDALPICPPGRPPLEYIGPLPAHHGNMRIARRVFARLPDAVRVEIHRTHPCTGQGPRQGEDPTSRTQRSEKHTYELQSREELVCRLLLEK